MIMIMTGIIMMMIIFRGYNRSGQPEGIDNYALEHLVEDVRGLVKVPPSNVPLPLYDLVKVPPSNVPLPL